VVKSQYGNGRTSLKLIDSEGFPFMSATVNVPDAKIAKGLTLIKNYGENEGIMEALCEQGFIENTGSTVRCGFVESNVVKVL